VRRTLALPESPVAIEGRGEAERMAIEQWRRVEPRYEYRPLLTMEHRGGPHRSEL
jgi:hypothetical protein